MDLIQPRQTYQRANTDDLDSKADYDVELSSIRTKSSSSYAFKDQIPLLDHADPIPTETMFDRPPKKHLRPPCFTWSSRLYGWRSGALGAAGIAVVSLLINVVGLAWLGSHKADSGLVEVFNGDCEKVERLDIWIHLAINAISTLLLGGSNYCMQCLSAPTRPEINRAHVNGRFLDIGVPSVRNLLSIPTYKTLLWLTLGLSSVPLHLMYNSAFYKSLSTNDYGLYFVKQDFIDSPTFTSADPASDTVADPTKIHADVRIPGVYERLDKVACIKAYATNFVSDRRNLVLVTKNETVDTSLIFDTEYFYTGLYQFQWICTSDPKIDDKITVPRDSLNYALPCETFVSKIIAIADEWQPYGYDVQYCLSERVPEKCSFNGNVPIVAVVVACNAVKIAVMLFVAFRLRDRPLITIGDAVESFLDESDRTTRGLCLLSKKDVVRYVRGKGHWSVEWEEAGGEEARKSTVARPQTVRWSQSASRLRWSLTIGFFLLALVVVGALLRLAISSIEGTGFTIASLGFGKVNPSTIISGWSVGSKGGPTERIIASILIANLPQTILSFLYLNLNGLLTSMWLASEWSDFVHERKTLRVSKPRGPQRSTHFLQLPYKVAIPLMALSGLLHWLISQSIFLAVVAEYTSLGELFSSVAVASCGFSPLAMILVLVAGVCIIIATIMLGLRKHSSAIPLVGSCSAAISAACHQPAWDADAAIKPVQWGVIPGSGDEGGVAHCAFTSGKVEPLQYGREYAGILERIDVDL
ncbi:uncharacterized protein Z518_00260 [Rhinocladiella mackenziei CBS 650.93]|uniref:Rhinocladiella mackenziei CBS 650.93 unplaced genomic scaffold supercont1.1, whole genome shotgun sequence n=1 Tax=Rhinocladiella mackenziei CBS 650.93 TaxID=1442369 RepID=A0A0D2J0I7_9EURO|nr:uncharacterized protein Z518_00260 [Rhinocladiella mackenziei CBS 650.93]KIX09181.1 hypothetical protein Z518_00260 [Rhinocladiella mackenziei CBS 650.93]